MMWIKFKTLVGDIRLVNMSLVREVTADKDGVSLMYENGKVHYDCSLADVEMALMMAARLNGRCNDETRRSDGNA